MGSTVKRTVSEVRDALRNFRNLRRNPGAWQLLANKQFMMFANEQTWLGRDSEYFDVWIDSLKRQGDLTQRFERPLPCYAFGAIRVLEGEITPEHRVFEYGSGSSTLWYAQRCAEVVAVEHDPSWHALVAAAAPPNVELHLHPGEPLSAQELGEHARGESEFGSWKKAELDFEKYVTAIDAYADGYFHIISVDGRARVACLERAVDKLAPGGLLILDNSQRDRYQQALARVTDRFPDATSYHGNSPFQARPQHTTIVRAPGSPNSPR